MKRWRHRPMKNQNENQPGGELILYQTEDGHTRIECRFEDETLWLSQVLMADLFQTTTPNINLHIKNILAEGELTEAATIKDYLIVRSEGRLGNVYQLFGEELIVILEEMNEVLAA